MRITLKLFVLAALSIGPAVWAQDQVAPRTAAKESEVTKGYLKSEVIGIKPNLGLLAYKDAAQNVTSRLSYGIGLEWNLISSVAPQNYSNWYAGLSSGFVYSHLGSPGSTFVGSNPSVPAGTSLSPPGANFWMIPANIKVGYNITDFVRISAHGGGNVIYRSVANAMDMGPSTSLTTGPVWRMFPNVGGDLELAVDKNVAILLRPDATISPGNDLFLGTVGVSFPFPTA